MKFREKLLIIFRRNKVVRLIITQKDKRVTERIVIPKSKGFCKLDDKTFRIDSENVFYGDKKIPTYLFYEEEATAFNALDPKKWKDKTSSPEDLETALNQSIAKDIIEATSGADSTKVLTIILLILTLLAVAGFGYFVYEQLNEIMQYLADLSNETNDTVPPWQQ